ncbi:MAG: hypothetical protein R3F31_20365 [Verrucomicrobiales bacterium]
MNRASTVPVGREAQCRLPELNDRADSGTYFCGSYFRYGFHEDALLSSVNLCGQLLEGSMDASQLKSCLYDCEVYHQHPNRSRIVPVSIVLFDLDLAELPELQANARLFSHNSFNVYAFRDADHLDLSRQDLRSNLEAWLAEQGQPLSPGAGIRLVTYRVFWDTFSIPSASTSFLVERFTPGRGGGLQHPSSLKPWLIACHESPGFFHLRVQTHFYVSPFTSLETEFDFRIRFPGDRIEIHIDDVEAGEPICSSWIRGERKGPLTDARLFGMRSGFRC